MKRRSLIAAVAASALVLAACGGDDDAVDDVEDVVDDVADEADDALDEAEDAVDDAADEVDDEAEDMTDEMTDDMTEDMTEDMTGETTGDTGEMTGDMAVPEDWPESIVFTLTPSQETGGLIETAEPLAQMLADRLGIEVEALVPTDYAGVIVALQSGQAQVAGGLGPRQMVQAEEQAGAQLILQSERFGSLTYVTQWMTNDPDQFCDDEPVADEDGFLFCNGVLDAAGPADGPIGQDKLALLEGQTVSFVDQGSTSGYAIPALQLVEAGIDPIEGVDGVFAGGHDNSVRAVYDGDALVGTSYNDARGDVVEELPDVGEQVVVFGWSGPIPNDGFAVGGDLPDSLVEAITQAFVDITEDEDGLVLLQELYNIDDLVPVNSADYDVIRDLEAELGDVLS